MYFNWNLKWSLAGNVAKMKNAVTCDSPEDTDETVAKRKKEEKKQAGKIT